MTDPQAIADGLSEAQLLDQALRENIALRNMISGGCDANNEGPHTLYGHGSNSFCVDCGEMATRGKVKPWFDEGRLERAMQRLSVRAILAKEEN